MHVLKSLPIDLPIQQAQLEKAILLGDKAKVDDFIKENPHLINTPFSSNYLPIELALAYKKLPLAQAMIESGAKLNIKKDNAPTTLDQIILQNDPEVYNDVLTPILGQIFYHTNKSIESQNTPLFQQHLKLAKEQLSAIEKEVQRFKDLKSCPSQNSICDLIDAHDLDALERTLIEQKEELSKKMLLDAICYAIMTHQNQAVEKLYDVFGDDILTIQTMCMKNLYHVASIANNPSMIQKLDDWNLTVAPQPPHSLNTISPFHYAIAHESLDTFFALSRTSLSYPAPCILNTQVIFNEYFQYFNQLNPTQLLVYRAHLNDPIKPISSGEKEFIFYNALYFGFGLLEDYFENFEGFNAIDSFFSFLVNISNIKRLSSILSGKSSVTQNLQKLFFLSSYFYYSTRFLNPEFKLKIPFLNISFGKLYSITTIMMAVFKMNENLTKYQQAYLFRPKKTAFTAIKDTIISAFIFKTALYDFSKRFDGSNCPTPFSEASNIKELKPRLNLLDKKQLSCCLKKSFKADSFVQCVFNYQMDLEEKKPIYRILQSLLHPDQCVKKLPKSFCEDYATKYLTKVNHWFGK